MSHEQKISTPHWAAHPTEESIKEKDGAICISTKALNIIWGNDGRYWKWTPLSKHETDFEYGAELLQVNWIEVTGKLDFSSPHFKKAGEYEIIYVVKFKVDAFGWHSSAIKFKVNTTEGQGGVISEVLEPYRKRSDQWHEIHGGKFTVPQSRSGAVYFGMYETQTDWWKGSMILAEVKIRPTKGS